MNEIEVIEVFDASVDVASNAEALLVSHSYKVGHPFDGSELKMEAVTKHGTRLGLLFGCAIQGRLSLDLLAVMPEFRGRGVGTTLVAAAEKWAADRNLAYVYLGTWDFQARAFYEKLGYEAFARLPEAEGFPGKTYLSKRLTRDLPFT